MAIFNFDQELYYRGVQYFNKLLFHTHKVKKDGSTQPLVARQTEEIKKPSLVKAGDWFAFFVGCVIFDHENDYAVSEILDHCIKLAQKNQFNGKWSIWSSFIIYNNLESCNCLENNKYERETVFDIPNLFNFLEQNFTNDEIFGNLLKRSAYLIYKIHKTQDRYRADLRRVKYAQRFSGYKDKGSLASFDSRARREANKLSTDTRDRRKIESIGDIVLWGKVPNS